MNKCPFCNKNAYKITKYEKKLPKLWQCSYCKLIFVYPQPTSNDLNTIYSESYFNNNNSGSCGYDNYFSDKKNIIYTAEKRLNEIEKIKNGKGSLLDVGCAMGFFLEAALSRGWDINGIDISEHAINIAKKTLGDRVSAGVLQNNMFSGKKFDVITMWDVLEHVPDPNTTLRIASSLLKKGGLLVVSTPDSGSMVAKIMGQKWMGFKDDEHLFYFTRQSLQLLFDKNGFSINKMYFTGKYITLDLFIKRIGLYSKVINMFLTLLNKFLKFSDRSLYINPYDIVTVCATKK